MVYRVTAGFPKEELYGLSKRLGLLGNQDSSLIEQKIVETEKVLSSLIRCPTICLSHIVPHEDLVRL